MGKPSADEILSIRNGILGILMILAATFGAYIQFGVGYGCLALAGASFLVLWLQKP